MKDKIYKFGICLLLVCHAMISYAQSEQQEMHDKYWFYRYRLTQEFLKKGLGDCGVPSGYSIPGSAAYAGGGQNSTNPDLKFGDGTSFLGNYIGTLAVELKLMLDNGASQDQLNRVKEELYFAMKAYERLDRQAEVILPPYQSNCDNSLNGFFVRDDIGYDNFFNGFKTPLTPDGFQKTLTSDYEQSINDIPCSQSHYRYPSMDQVSNLLVGFSLVVKSIPYQSYLESNGNAYHFDDMAKFYSDKIATYLNANDYSIPVPNTSCYAQHGGPTDFESQPLSYGVAYAADKIKEGDFGGDPVVCWGQCLPSNNPYASSPVVEMFAGMWQNFFNYPSGKTYVLNNYNEANNADLVNFLSHTVWPYKDIYNAIDASEGHQNNNAVFMQFAAVGNLWRAGLTSEHSTIHIPIFAYPECNFVCDNYDWWNNCIWGHLDCDIAYIYADVDMYCYNNNIGNQLGGYITNFLFDNAARADLFSYLPDLCVPFFPLPEFSVNTTSTALSEYGNMMDGQYFPLLHQYLHDCGPYTYDEWNLYNKLLSAPCSGPHYKPIRDVNNPPPIGSTGLPDWTQASTSEGIPGWQVENRWEKSNAAKNPPGSSGGWNGIDYMIAYNLFHSVKGGSYNFVPYEDLIYREIHNKTYNPPSNVSVVGFEKILVDNTTINSGATVNFHAGISIKFTSGDVIKRGSNVSAKINPVFGCSTSSGSTYARTVSNNTPPPATKQNGEELLKQAVTKQMENYKNEFQQALTDNKNASSYISINNYVAQAKNESGISDITLFPNPAANRLYLTKNQFESNKIQIEIRNVVGEIQLTSEQYISGSSSTIEVDISELSSGYYFCKSTCGSYSKTIQFVKN